MTHIVAHFGKLHARVFKSQVIPVVKVCLGLSDVFIDGYKAC